MQDTKQDALNAINASSVEHLLEEKLQNQVDAEELARKSERTELMRILAHKRQLGLGDWIEITCIGIDGDRHYTISGKGVYFNGTDKDTIHSSPIHLQANMVRQNEEDGLAFPCTPRELIDFVDSGAGRLSGSFLIPCEFRDAVIQIERTHTCDVVGQDLPKTKAEEDDAGEEIHRGMDGAPYLRKGKNSRKKVIVWVIFQAHQLLKKESTVNELASEIKLEADRCGYESERRALTVPSITKMIPVGLTGGRSKRSDKSKK